MDLNQFLQIAAAGILGLLFNVCMKIYKLKQQNKIANVKFSLSAYLIDDWPLIAGNLVVIFFILFSLDEIIKIRPEVENYIKLLFFFIGYFGSSLANMLLSKSEKKVFGIIDEKTNIADSVTQSNKENDSTIPPPPVIGGRPDDRNPPPPPHERHE